MFYQVDMIPTPCYDWLLFDHYQSLTIAKMFGFFPCYPTYAHQICSKAIPTVFKESRPWRNNKSFDLIPRMLSDHMKP